MSSPFCAQAYILTLPDELITAILKHADYKAVVACRRSCRRLKEIVEASSVLQYSVELAAAGMCNGAPNGMVPAKRLRRLRRTQTAWKSSPWSSVDHFPYSREMSPFTMIASGNLVVFRNSRSHTGELILLRFPSESRGIPEQLWYLDLKCNRIDASCADDSQDLLVFSSLSTIYIRTLSTGTVHPLTSTAGCIHSFSILGGLNLYIHGNLLSISSSIGGFVWDWKTGENVAEIPITTCYLPFLDRHRVISPQHDYIRGNSFFQVTTLPDVPGGALSHIYHFMLEPPNFITPYFMDMWQANTLPASWSSSDHVGWFHADPDEILLTIELGSPTTSEPVGTFMWHTLHVPHNVFLSYIAAHHRSSTTLRSETETETETDGVTGRRPAVVVPWDAWGPGHTHLTTETRPGRDFIFKHKVCGMHALGEPHILPDRRVVRIADYHPHRVARALTADQGVDGGGDDEPGPGPGEEGARRGRPDQDQDQGQSMRGQIPYIEKDIPLPDGVLRRPESGVKCMLGEDVVVLLELSGGDPMHPPRRIEKIYYHPI